MKLARLVPYQTQSHCALGPPAAAEEEGEFFKSILICAENNENRFIVKFMRYFSTFPFCLFFFFAIEVEARRRTTLIRTIYVVAKEGGGRCDDAYI